MNAAADPVLSPAELRVARRLAELLVAVVQKEREASRAGNAEASSAVARVGRTDDEIRLPQTR